MIDEAPHDWLLPRVVAAVHHGGIGTVAAALRPGVPQVVRPFLDGQPFWADRLHRLGVSPNPLTGRLTAARPASAIAGATAMAPAAYTLAGRLAGRLAGQDGTRAAVTRVEHVAQFNGHFEQAGNGHPDGARDQDSRHDFGSA